MITLHKRVNWKLTWNLEEPLVKQSIEKSDFDIVEYQRKNNCRLPQVIAMALDILAIPVTTIASKFTFNVGGRVLNEFRIFLLPSTIEALVTQDWFYGDKRPYNFL